MEDIIHAFGVDTRLIIIQIVNFLILMTALGYFLYTPLLNLLKERAEKVAQGIADAEAAAAARTNAEAEKKQVLAEAHGAAVEVANRAKVAAEEKASAVIASADARAAAIIGEAEKNAARLHTEATKSAEADIAKAALLAAEKILREKAS
jgi:F-type H+-transporting ATPase subunit b